MNRPFKLPISSWKKSSVSHGTWTYFIGCQDFVKIGSAREPLKRMMHMQVGNPFPLSLIAVSSKPERLMQNSFAIHHERGEWFRNRHQIEASLSELWLDEYGSQDAFSIDQIADCLRVSKKAAQQFIAEKNVFEDHPTEGQFLFLLALCTEFHPDGLVLFEDTAK